MLIFFFYFFQNLNSIWDSDQIDAYLIYRKEIEKLEKISKKQILFYQKKFQDVNKESEFINSCYVDLNNKFFLIKNKIDELNDSKNAYENVIEILNNEINFFSQTERKQISDGKFFFFINFFQRKI